MGERLRQVAAALLLVAAGIGGGLPAARAAQVAPPTADCTAGSSGRGDGLFAFMGNGGYDVRDYAIDLDIDVDAGAIRRGATTIQAVATASLCRFNLDFFGLEIDRVAVNGAPATWDRQGQELVVTPAAPLAAGSGFAVEVVYHGTPYTLTPLTRDHVLGAVAAAQGLATPAATPEAAAMPEAAATPEAGGREVVVLDGNEQELGYGPDTPRYGWSLGGWWKEPGAVFAAGEPRGAETWYPVNGHPADKAQYTFRLTVDAPYVAAANGELAGIEERDGRLTSTWVAREPMASYLTTLFAGAGEIVQRTGDDGRAYRYVYASRVPAWQRQELERLTPEIVDFYETRFGPYPFSVAGGVVVDSPIPFALETQTMPLYGGLLDAPELGISRAEQEAYFEGIVAHEIGHQWFGDNVTPLRWQDIVLSEGMATYAADLWIERTQGEAALVAQLRPTYDVLAAQSRIGRLANDPEALAATSAADLWADVEAAFGPLPPDLVDSVFAAAGIADADGLAGKPAADLVPALEAAHLPVTSLASLAVLPGRPDANSLFSSDVYQRGALALHALRLEVGDATFFAILTAWGQTFRHGNATVQDLVAVAGGVSGRDLWAFFDGWLFQPEVPPLALPDAGAATPAA